MPLIIVAVVAVAAVVGIGVFVLVSDDDDSSGTGPEQAVADWSDAVVDGDCPAIVAAFSDDGLDNLVPALSQEEGTVEQREGAVEQCRQAVEAGELGGNLTEEVRQVGTDGARAEVELIYRAPYAMSGPDGEGEAGVELRVETIYLVEEGDRWLIDELGEDVALSDRDAAAGAGGARSPDG